MVGFPGEQGHNFRNTLSVIRKTLPLKVHIFPYSKREKTPAYSQEYKFSPAELRRRIGRLEKLAASSALKYKNRFLGKKAWVLVEELSDTQVGFWQGYADNYLKVIVPAKNDLKDKLIRVRIKELSKDCLVADLC